mmetsp:Transcript_145402/g.253754  ORF Transcript_145402/g.253754 Transcript_145402/m.253754 type:complete len:182 (-) Transcript_145402:89-634(-)
MGKNELPEIEERTCGSLYSRTDLLKVMSEYLNDALPRVDYEEDHFFTNIRIALSMVCCGFGCYAQFGAKFPRDRYILGACVIGYFIFSGILGLFDYYIMKQSVICIKAKDSSVFVDLNLPVFSDEITMSLRPSSKNSGIQPVEHKCSVARYFDSEKQLSQQNLFGDFTKLMEKYEKAGKKA